MNKLDGVLGALMASRSELDSLATGSLHKALATALVGFSRRRDLRQLAGLLATADSKWQAALQVEALLSDFETRAYPRIAAGFRLPRNEIEELMVAVLEAGPPPCARTIWEALR